MFWGSGHAQDFRGGLYVVGGVYDDKSTPLSAHPGFFPVFCVALNGRKVKKRRKRSSLPDLSLLFSWDAHNAIAIWNRKTPAEAQPNHLQIC